MVNPLLLPSPVEVVARLGTQIANGELAQDTAVSVYRILGGFLIATAMSLPLGMLMGTSRRVEAALEPFVDFVRYMPVVAFVPLTILWVGTGDAQKFLIIWMGTFFQQILLVADAVRRVPRPLIDLGETLGMDRGKILSRIVLRASAPAIWDTVRVTLGWAWTWLVVAELVAANSGLGHRITNAQRYFQTDTIIAYVLVLGLLGLVTDQLMRAAGRRMFRYERIGR
ncbi:MAG: ABC transporter permease [Cellulomonadaceae bacterium]|nr:ABC transporter permease [Cellulomonadaceae bacterium]